MVVGVTGDPAAAFQAARREALQRQWEGVGAGRAAPLHTGVPVWVPVASQPRTPAPRPSPTAASYASPGTHHAVGERLDLIRDIMIAQREQQQ